MADNRDDFAPSVIAKARELVQSICSNAGCRVWTMSARPGSPGDTVNVGTAAHIHAAAPLGPRYDESQRPEERRGIANAIWLCGTCARLIDSDVAAYPAELLRQWKAEAERDARGRLGKKATTVEEASAEERARTSGQLGALVLQVAALDVSLQAGFVRHLDLRAPPLVATAIAREATVGRILQALGARRWLAIHGEIAVGKTHLAGLLARARGDAIWIRTRDVDAPEAAARIEAATRARRATLPPTVVLDDLPPLREELIAALTNLYSVLDAGTVVVSTSNHRLLPRLEEFLPPNSILEESCPRLTNEEAAELLRAHGALDLSEKAIAFLNGLAARHPALLTAVSRYLRARQWVWDTEALGALFGREHLVDVNRSTIRALAESVPAEASRSLLYRLTLVRGPFDSELVSQLAAVTPAITLAHERVLELEGLWLDRQDAERYVASPLVTSLPSSVVDDATRVACCKLLAERTLRGTVTPDELIDATTYFVQAREFDAAVRILSAGLVSFVFEKKRASPGDLLLLWWTAPLPLEASADDAVSLRCAQIAAGLKVEKNVDYLVEDLAQLLTNPGLSWGPVAGAAVAFQGLFETNPSVAATLLRVAVRKFDTARIPSGERLSVEVSVRPELLVWLVAPRLKTNEHVDEWVGLVLDLPASAPDASMGWLSERDGCLAAIDGVWQREVDRPEQERDWSAIVARFTSIRAAALQKGRKYVAAVATRAEIIVLAEHQGRVEDALTLADETIPLVLPDSRGAFLIEECKGRQQFYKGDVGGARSTLDAALKRLDRDEDGGIEILVTLNCAVRAASSASSSEAVAYAKRAKAVAESLGAPGRLEVARTSGELAIASERIGDRAGTYAALSAGAEALLRCDRDSDRWKRVAAAFAHTAGYVAWVVSRGRPPPGLPNGEGFKRPEQGLFYVGEGNVERSLLPQAMSAVCIILADLASVIGAHDDATRWGKRTLDEADADPYGKAPEFIPAVLPHMVRGALADLSVLEDPIVASALSVRQRSEQPGNLIIGLAMVPVAGEILGLSALAGGALGLCERAAQLCTDVSIRLDGDKDWAAAAVVFQTAASSSGGVNDLLRLANSFVGSPVEGLHLIAALLASVDGRRRLRTIAQAHLAILDHLIGPNLAFARDRVLANMQAYWRQMADTAAFQFAHPRLLREELAAIPRAETVDSAARVLRAVGRDLGVKR